LSDQTINLVANRIGMVKWRKAKNRKCKPIARISFVF
jgi:hypothetical protein